MHGSGSRQQRDNNDVTNRKVASLPCSLSVRGDCLGGDVNAKSTAKVAAEEPVNENTFVFALCLSNAQTRRPSARRGQAMLPLR